MKRHAAVAARAAVLLLGLLLTGVAAADPAATADAVIEAAEASDPSRLEALAKRPGTPWLVIDELCRRGAHDHAVAFARAFPDPARAKRLEAYAERRRGLPDDAAARELKAQTAAALQRKDGKKVLALLDAKQLDPHTVIGLRLLDDRAKATFLARDWPRSLRAYGDVAKAATELGWLSIAQDAYHRYGMASYNLSNWDDALASWDRARQVAVERGHRKGVANALLNMAIIYGGQGDLKRALEASRFAREECLAIGDAGRAASALSNIAIDLARTGQLLDAIGAAKQAAQEFDDLGQHDRAQGIRGNLALHYLQLGDYPNALRYLEETLAADIATGDEGRQAGTLSNLGLLHIRLSEASEARPLIEKALALSKKSGARHTYAITLGHLGVVLKMEGESAEAREVLREALDLRRKVGDRAAAADTEIQLAIIESTSGSPAKAITVLEKALAEQTAMGNRRIAGHTMLNIGDLKRSQGEFAGAIGSYDAAGVVFDETADALGAVMALAGRAAARLGLRELDAAMDDAKAVIEGTWRLAGGLEEQRSSGLREKALSTFHVGIEAAIKAEDADRLVWFLEQGRAVMLREAIGAREALERAVIPERHLEALKSARRQEQDAALALREARRAGRRKTIRTARTAWREAVDATALAMGRVRREARAGAAITMAEPDDLKTIRKRLESRDAFVMYGLTDRAAVAVVIRKTSVQIAVLDTPTTIRSAVDAVLTEDPKDTAPDAAVKALRTLIVDPLKIGSPVTRVLVSPMGRLAYVPFSLMFPRQTVTMVPSASAYGLLQATQRKGGEAILALGDPAYHRAAGRRTKQRGGSLERLAALPATRDEALAIGTTTLLGESATESGLAEAVKEHKQWRAIHFACHGIVDAQRPMFSALALTPDETDDGYLRAIDIIGTPFPADLVVMSACETGRGRIYKTEGIVGLTNAFMLSGAPRVIASLWKVDDDATRALMTRFYELWNDKVPVSEALKQAQEHVRSQPPWSAPYYWAAWVLWGLPD